MISIHEIPHLYNLQKYGVNFAILYVCGAVRTATSGYVIKSFVCLVIKQLNGTIYFIKNFDNGVKYRK